VPFPRCHAYETWNIFYKMILKFSQNQWCSNKLYTPKWSTINSESINNYFAAFSTVKKLFYDKWNLLLPESTMWCLQRSIFKYLNWGAAIANWMSKKYKPNFTWIKVRISWNVKEVCNWRKNLQNEDRYMVSKIAHGHIEISLAI
jgi:hypothetical protein